MNVCKLKCISEKSRARTVRFRADSVRLWLVGVSFCFVFVFFR
jgi:hypothetical protein